MRYCSILAILIALAGGCTYSFRGQTAGSIKSISIAVFENETAEFGIAERVTDELVRGFQKDGTIRIATADQADAALLGRITRVEDLPYTARADQTVEEYRFALGCVVELVDNSSQQPMWSQSFSTWSIYTYTGSLEARDDAITEAVGKLQEDLLNKIVGSW